jgi:hypothetical protein
VALERHHVLDLLPARSVSSVCRWLRQHPQVDVVCRDRSGLFAEAIAEARTASHPGGGSLASPAQPARCPGIPVHPLQVGASAGHATVPFGHWGPSAFASCRSSASRHDTIPTPAARHPTLPPDSQSRRTPSDAAGHCATSGC